MARESLGTGGGGFRSALRLNADGLGNSQWWVRGAIPSVLCQGRITIIDTILCNQVALKNGRAVRGARERRGD